MRNLENFIPTIRTDRFREIKNYEDKGYSFNDKRGYRMVDTIETTQNNYCYKYGVEVTQNEIYFYIIDRSANIYLSFIDIYNILIDISYKEGIDFVIRILKEQLRIKVKKKRSKNINKDDYINQVKFLYRGIEYNIRKTVKIKKTNNITIPDSSLEISYEYLFMLINLIQEKSNCLFLQGKLNKNFADGLLRMYIALLCNIEDKEILSNIGWKYNNSSNKFEFFEPSENTERNKKKYYLTKTEYENIIK